MRVPTLPRLRVRRWGDDPPRAFYAWIGFHIVLHDLRFAQGLATSDLARAHDLALRALG